MVYPMPLSNPTHQQNDELLNIIARCDYLELTTSKSAFPQSKGSGLPVLSLDTPLCKAYIALQGAHLVSFEPKNGQPLLWVSPNCDFTPGVALRGGIPICLPWFGPHATDPQKPKHGFARNQDWALSQANLTEDGIAHLVFELDSPANALFDYHFAAQLHLSLGRSIKAELTLSNKDEIEFDCSWALHSYFPVSSLSDVRVKGLSERTYLDNLEKHAEKFQSGDVSFPSEVDRVFPAVENAVSIAGNPNIEITHHNCPSVIVWNPGSANAAKIADIGAGNEQTYICVERGAVLSEKWHLRAGESASAWMEIKEI